MDKNINIALLQKQKEEIKQKIQEILIIPRLNTNVITKKMTENQLQKFDLLVNESLYSQRKIKLIIKTLSSYIHKYKDYDIKREYYYLLLHLIDKLTMENILNYLAYLLVALQEIMDCTSTEKAFEKILNNLTYFNLKTFEMLNGFCLHAIKNNSVKIQNSGLLCYANLISSYKKCNDNNISENNIIKSFFETIKSKMNNSNFYLKNKYQLLYCLNKLITTSKEKYIYFIDETFQMIIKSLRNEESDIQNLILDFFYNMIKYNKLNMNDNLKEDITKYILLIINQENIQQKCIDILNILDLNSNNNKKNNEKIKGKIISNYSFNNSDKKNKKGDIFYDKKMKNNYSFNNINFNKNNQNKILFKNYNKPPNTKNRIIFRNNLPQNNHYSDRISNNNEYSQQQQELTFSKNNYNNFQESRNMNDCYLSTQLNESNFVNPIKLWYNFDTSNNDDIFQSKNKKPQKKNKNKNSSNKKNISINQNQLNIKNTIKANKINFIQQTPEEKLKSILSEMKNISNTQNYLAEMILELEKNTNDKIEYFNKRVSDIEKTNTKTMKLSSGRQILIDVINCEKNDYDKIDNLKYINTDDIQNTENGIIEDVVNKMIYFMERGWYIHESILLIKKIISKNKRRLKIETVKSILGALNIVLENNLIKTNEDSFNISLIISCINVNN